MELKMREKLNINSLTFKKKVLEETIDLMGVVKNYTDTSLKYTLMLGFLDNVIEGKILLEKLAKSTRLLDEIEDTVEPLYKSIILEDENNLKVYNELLQELKNYFDREIINNRHIAGLLYNILNEMGSLTPEAIMTMVSQVVDLASNKFIPTATKKEDKTQIVKSTKNVEVENQKMMELIEQFKNQKDITKQ